MPKRIATIAGALCSILVMPAGASQTTSASSEIDRGIWSVFTATVAAEDIVGMGRLLFSGGGTGHTERDDAHQGDAREMGTRHGRRQSQG